MCVSRFVCALCVSACVVYAINVSIECITVCACECVRYAYANLFIKQTTLSLLMFC